MQSFFKLAVALGLVTTVVSTAEHLVSHGMAKFIHSEGGNEVLNTRLVKYHKIDSHH